MKPPKREKAPGRGRGYVSYDTERSPREPQRVGRDGDAQAAAWRRLARHLNLPHPAKNGDREIAKGPQAAQYKSPKPPGNG